MKRKLSLFLLSGLGVFVLLGLGAAYVHFYFGPWLAEKGFETVIQSALGEKATISRTVVHWLGRPGIEYRGFSIGGTGEDGGWLRVERIVVRPKLRSLFSKSIRWKSLDLDHPVLRLSWKGRQSPLEYLLPILSQFDRLQVRRGKIEWHDREIQDLFVSLSNLSTSGPFPLVLGGALKAGNGFPAWVSVRGLIHNLSGKWDLSSLKLSAEIEAKGLDPFWFGGHFAQYIPSELTGSRITVMAKFDGDLKGRFQSFGTLSITGSRLFEEMGRLSANFSLNWDGQELEFQKIHLKIPDLPLEARGRIYGMRGADPVVSFQVDCPWVSIGKQGRILPLLPENVRSLLKSAQAGEVALVSLGFTGSLRNLEFPKNEASLHHWTAGVRFRNLVVPWNGETFRLKNGSAKIEHGAIVADAVGISLGSSELEVPRLYLSQPFTNRSIDMILKGEVSLTDIPKWISMGLIPEEVAIPMSNMEVLSGRGDVSLRVKKRLGLLVPPALTGRLTLQDAAIRISYFPGTFRRLKGVLEFSSGDLILRDVKGRWMGSTAIATGSVGALFSQHPKIDLSLKGQLDLKDLGELASWGGLPRGTRAVLQEIGSPSGKGGYSLSVKGPLGMPERVEVRGELTVRGGSLQAWNAYPVERVRGRILLSRDGISIPDLRGIWRNSNLALKAVLTRPGTTSSRDLTFSAVFDLQDIASERFDHGWPRTWKKFLKPFDFQSGKALVEVTERKRNGRATVEGQITFEEATVRYVPVFPPLTNLEGKVSLAKRGIKTLNVQGKFDSSLVKIQGDLAPGSEDSKPYLSIQAEKVDLEKVLSWPWTEGFSDGQKVRSPLVVHVRIDQGDFREITVSDVEAKMRLEGDRLSFENLAFASGEGQGLIRGWVGFGKDGELFFEFQPYLLKVETSPILTSFQRAGTKRQLTGLGSAFGVIRGRGKGLHEIARSLSGEVGLFIEKGRIAQFDVVSKVFSLLDISQVVRGNFPDLKTAGMSYRTISGQVTLDEGRVSTSDLLIDSESMKISVVGGLEIPSGGLDLTLGLRRVGAGGKIVRTVPIFGEIVTTDGGSFIHYYLEVKGTIAEPEVKGIPFMSISDGVSGLMRRLLETPGGVIPFQRQPELEEYFEKRKHPYP